MVNSLNCDRVNYKDWLFHDIGTSMDCESSGETNLIYDLIKFI